MIYISFRGLSIYNLVLVVELNRYEGLVLLVCGDGKVYIFFFEIDFFEDDFKFR